MNKLFKIGYYKINEEEYVTMIHESLESDNLYQSDKIDTDLLVTNMFKRLNSSHYYKYGFVIKQ